MRERLIHPTGRLIAALLASLVILTGCSSAVGQEDAGGKAKDGGTLRIGTSNDIVPATIFTNSSDATNTLIGAVYDTLVDYPLDSVEPQPALATSWKLAPNGKELTLQLRDDVKFHTGRELTSKDVEFSIKTWADPTWSVQLQRTAAAITGFVTTDPNAIKLTFEHPLSNVFDLLDILPIIDQETFAELKTGKKYVGTGPFKFEEWKPNSELTFSRNDDYWQGKPKLDGIKISVISDAQSQVSALRSGQLDLITGASNRDVESLDKDKSFEVDEWEGAENQIYVGSNVQHPVLKDPKLRKAIAFALDRDRIVKDVYRGAGKATSLPWPEYSPAYDEKAARTYDRDLDQAKKLVGQVGKVPTLPLTYPAGDPNYEAVALIVQSNLEEIGIKTKLEPVEYTQFIKKLIGADFEALWILQHNYAQFTPSTLAVSAYPFNADKNASHFSGADYKAHADGAWTRPSGTDKGALKLYDDLNRDLLDNLFLTEIATLYPQTVRSNKVHDVTLTKRNELHLDETYLSE